MATGFDWFDEPGGPKLDPGALVLSSFPSAGLAATVAAHYIVQTLKLPRIGVLRSSDTLPVAIIQRGEVQPPVRVYGRKDLALVLSEFPPSPDSAGELASAILDGAERRQARLVLGLEGVVLPPMLDDEPDEPGKTESVWVATSKPDKSLAESFARAKTRLLEEGVIGGVTGAMLVDGMYRTTPVAVFLVSAHVTEGYPDHRAGAALIEALDRFLPELAIDTAPLRVQAEMIEKALRAAMASRKEPTPSDRPVAPGIYG